MSSIAKVSIALPLEMVALLKQAVATGDYASNSEVVREALREWRARRNAPNAEPEKPRPTDNPRLDREEAGSAVRLALRNVSRRELQGLCRRYGVLHLALFGSVLTDPDPATCDLEVTVEFGKARGASSERHYSDFKAALERLFERPVDLVELAMISDSRLKRSIELNQVPIFGKTA